MRFGVFPAVLSRGFPGKALEQFRGLSGILLEFPLESPSRIGRMVLVVVLLLLLSCFLSLFYGCCGCVVFCMLSEFSSSFLPKYLV